MVTDKKLNGLLDKFWANIKKEINNKAHDFKFEQAEQNYHFIFPAYDG